MEGAPTMRRRLAWALLLGLVLALWNVTFSTDSLKQGDTLVITGTAKVLESWPRALKSPGTAYISVVAPGPVFLMKDRVINGQESPASFYIEKGHVYDFKLTLVGRVPVRYHVHPSFSVRGSGALIGPGQWVTVQKNPAGFSNPQTLYNGKTVNLENYG